MKPRVTFTVCELTEHQKDAVGDLLEKVRGFADMLEEYIVRFTIINRDDAESRNWLVNVPPTDNSSVTCVLSRHSGDDPQTVSIVFAVTRNDKMPNVQRVVAYLYPEFT